MVGDVVGFFGRLKYLFFGNDEKEVVKETKVQDNIAIKEVVADVVPKSKTIESKPIVITRQESNYDEEHQNLYFEDLWNYIDPTKNTQAHHVISVVGFDEWIDMDEIRVRIKQMFFIEYKNEKSLYPYIKTLTDVGLLETNSAGGKRKWKKRELVIKLKPYAEQKIRINEKIKV